MLLQTVDSSGKPILQNEKTGLSIAVGQKYIQIGSSQIDIANIVTISTSRIAGHAGMQWTTVDYVIPEQGIESTMVSGDFALPQNLDGHFSAPISQPSVTNTNGLTFETSSRYSRARADSVIGEGTNFLVLQTPEIPLTQEAAAQGLRAGVTLSPVQATQGQMAEALGIKKDILFSDGALDLIKEAKEQSAELVENELFNKGYVSDNVPEDLLIVSTDMKRALSQFYSGNVSISADSKLEKESSLSGYNNPNLIITGFDKPSSGKNYLG